MVPLKNWRPSFKILGKTSIVKKKCYDRILLKQELILFKITRCDYCSMNVTQEHGLSQQGVWVSYWTPKPLKSTPRDTHFFLVKNFLKCQSQAYNKFFHLHFIPMTLYKDIMPNFDKFIHVYG